MTERSVLGSMAHGTMLGITILSLIVVSSIAAFCITQMPSVTITSYGRIIYPNNLSPSNSNGPTPSTPLWYETLDVCAKVAAIMSCVIAASMFVRSHKDSTIIHYNS